MGQKRLSSQRYGTHTSSQSLHSGICDAGALQSALRRATFCASCGWVYMQGVQRQCVPLLGVGRGVCKTRDACPENILDRGCSHTMMKVERGGARAQVITLADVNIVNLERVGFGLRNFDMAVVPKARARRLLPPAP